jgi:hypothetical protein
MARLGDITSGRRSHILDGDDNSIGGGHRWNSRNPGKTKFPRSWDDDKVISMIQEVARRPDGLPERYDNGRRQCTGTRDEVEIVVILNEDGTIRTAHPRRGPGVTVNRR